jgi:hypothetical protein
MTLGQVAKENDNACGDDQRGRWIPPELFDKDLQEHIIEYDTDHGDYKVAEQLYSSFQERTLEHHVHTQVKADGERKAKGNKKGSNVGREGNEPKVQDLLFQDEIVCDKINKDVQQCVTASASCVAKHLQGHKPLKQRIEQVYKPKDESPYFMVDTPH